MHLDEEQIQRFLHGEEDDLTARASADHLRSCPQCRERLASAERDQREVYGLLRLADGPPPAVTAEQVIARARSSGVGWGRWAAGILLAVAVAGGAYAMPGSPLPGWLHDVRAPIQGPERSPRPPEPAMPLLAGIAVPPGERLVILFERSHPEARARITLGDWAEVRVRGPSGGATFGSEADTLRVGNRDSTATFEIEIPRGARMVEIRVAGARIFTKDGPRVTASGGGESAEVYLLPLSAP
jgi:hypothetical protein